GSPGYPPGDDPTTGGGPLGSAGRAGLQLAVRGAAVAVDRVAVVAALAGVALPVTTGGDAARVEALDPGAGSHHAAHDVAGGVDPGVDAAGVVAARRPRGAHSGALPALVGDRHRRGIAA